MGDLQTIREELSIRDIWEARKRIVSIVNKTPLIQSFVLSEKAGRPVYLKLENVHDIGAFKVRGAANKILSLSEDVNYHFISEQKSHFFAHSFRKPSPLF
ncbi:hypothetical protein GEPA3_2332 [Geobacillus sp. PA-3]|nr:hypothetical protein GEPA3_2332 [Geobacillus sp. PA-3]